MPYLYYDSRSSFLYAWKRSSVPSFYVDAYYCTEKTQWSSPDGMQYHESLIEARDESTSIWIGFVDCLNLATQHSWVSDIQNATFNSWLSRCHCSQVITFAPDELMIFAHVDSPRPWHESKIAHDLYSRFLIMDIEYCIFGLWISISRVLLEKLCLVSA